MFAAGSLVTSRAVQYTYRCGCSETAHFTSPGSWHYRSWLDLLPHTPQSHPSADIHSRLHNITTTVLLENEDCHDCWAAETEAEVIRQRQGLNEGATGIHDGDADMVSHDDGGAWPTTRPVGEHCREPLREISENLKPKSVDRVRVSAQ